MKVNLSGPHRLQQGAGGVVGQQFGIEGVARQAPLFAQPVRRAGQGRRVQVPGDRGDPRRLSGMITRRQAVRAQAQVKPQALEPVHPFGRLGGLQRIGQRGAIAAAARLVQEQVQPDGRHGPSFPPTPIASPGNAALEAVLHPERHKFLYFVSRGDGTSEFSTDLAAHNRAVGKYILKR